jgi:hypothetical protein
MAPCCTAHCHEPARDAVRQKRLDDARFPPEDCRCAVILARADEVTE